MLGGPNHGNGLRPENAVQFMHNGRKMLESLSRRTKIYLGFCLLCLLMLPFSFLDTLRAILFWIFVLPTILYYAYKYTRKIVRKLLWRIRRKLIISYIFIGLTPIVLLAILILLG